MDDMVRKLGPNYICNTVSDYDEFAMYGFTGCGTNSALYYMVSF
jgi:hypothetical protein